MNGIETLIFWLVVGSLYAGFVYIVWRVIAENRKFKREIEDIVRRHSGIKREIKEAYDLRMRDQNE